jgi:signal transduction histidine kinase/CheY-like chemotaxis protein
MNTSVNAEVAAQAQSADATAPAHAAEAARALECQVQAEQTTLLYRRSQSATLAGVGFALLVCIGLAPYLPRDPLWGWFALRCCVAVLRFTLGFRFNQAHAAEEPLWHRWFVAALVLDGLSWSLLGAWLAGYVESPLRELLITSLVGVSAVAVFVLQPSWRASVTFLAGALLPVAAVELVSGRRSGVFTALALITFVLLLYFEARRAEARIHELLRLRFSTARIAEERAQALQLAQRQSHVKGQFLATMSHEMRTPLHGILGVTRMLQQHPGEAPAAQLALIERAGEHLLTLINDVLDFSKLEAGQVKLAEQVFDLAALVEDVVSLSIPPACEAGLTLTAKLLMSRPCPVRGDPARVRQVLHNLVGNAVKFTEMGSVTVVAKYHVGRGRARITVQDTGVGIPAEDLTRIFDAFQQADGSFTRRYGGTGLGLTIARELAQAMGGDLTCTSEIGRGSTFTVTLNLPAQEVAPLAQVDVALEAPAPPLQGRVLLAEDNLVNALVAEAALQKIGLEVQVVPDGASAVEAFAQNRPEFVLLDCQMPVMDGFEAARRMRALEAERAWPRTPLIALTANALAGDREASLAAGMDEHLAKPFREEQLRELLRRYLTVSPAPSTDPADGDTVPDGIV